jgi:chemotaxis signal transduction protein
MSISVESQRQDIVKPFLGLDLTDDTKAFLPTDQLVEILSLGWEQIIPIPGTNNSVIGAFNWRQNIIWLIDLPLLFGLSSIKNQMNSISKIDIVIVKCGTNKLGLSLLRTGQIIRDLSPENDLDLFLDSKKIYNMVSGVK